MRKKKRMGEYQETCFSIGIYFVKACDENAMNVFFDDFIAMIEANKMVCGGGMNLQAKTFGMSVSSDIRRGKSKRLYMPVTDEQVNAVSEWCRARKEVYKIKIGEKRDAWHGWTDKEFDMTFDEEMVGAEIINDE
jgi:uncharacterized protein YggL (DUF469 family)